MKKQDTHRMTKDGLLELQSELKKRTGEKRVHLKKIIEDMRDKGDLSENDGYTLSLDEFESNERRIAELEVMIENSEIVTKSQDSKASLGSILKVKSVHGEVEYTIVGKAEANPMEGKISEDTPLGKALMGQKIGDKVKVVLPRAEVEYEIIELK